MHIVSTAVGTALRSRDAVWRVLGSAGQSNNLADFEIPGVNARVGCFEIFQGDVECLCDFEKGIALLDRISGHCDSGYNCSAVVKRRKIIV